MVLVVNVLFFWQWRHPFVLFTSHVANEISGWFLALGLPWLIAVQIFLLRRRWARALAIGLCVPLLLYSAVAAFGMVITSDTTFDRIAETKWRGSAVRLYRASGGATGDFGVVIRQERAIFPGVLLVRTLDDFYHCHSLDAVGSGEGVQIEDKRSDCDAFPGQQKSYRLKSFVYF